jgi:hypothetical protein
MEVVVMRKENYGNVRFYPENKEAKILATLMGKKTFDYSELQLTREMGANITVKYPEVKL